MHLLRMPAGHPKLSDTVVHPVTHPQAATLARTQLDFLPPLLVLLGAEAVMQSGVKNSVMQVWDGAMALTTATAATGSRTAVALLILLQPMAAGLILGPTEAAQPVPDMHLLMV
jgi:hypothetical protein